MERILTLDEAIQCAKDFDNFDGVLMAVSLQPQWLTTIPGARQWAIIHHVVYSKNIEHLNQLLAQQKSNANFRLLSESRKNETILDIAKVLNDEKKMYQHIERLVQLDQMLNYAKNCEWDSCFEIIQANPSYGNKKPPYRQFYLIHHLACAGEIEQFERFQQIPGFTFDLNLRVDRKKINAIARENRRIQFAEYIEGKYPDEFRADEVDDQFYQPSDMAKQHTNQVNGLMDTRNLPPIFEWSLAPAANHLTRAEVDKHAGPKLIKQQQEKAKAASTSNPTDQIRTILTCSLTHAIVKDPGR